MAQQRLKFGAGKKKAAKKKKNKRNPPRSGLVARRVRVPSYNATRWVKKKKP